jgi:RNA ligase
MLLVQEFLKTKTLKDLEMEHAVNARIERGYKASFNYDQISARDSDKLAQQCRGLILRTADGSPMVEDKPLGETVIIARPFDRFFNHGQEAAAEVDLSHPETAIFEKLDGTLCILHFDDVHGEWHIATRSVSEANLQVGSWAGMHTFRSLFEKALSETLGVKFSEWTGDLSKGHTYMFELCTPMNQVVVKHDNYSITLIGCRETQTGHEAWPDEIAPQIRVPHVARHRFGHVEEMLEFVRQRDPKQYEGIVACQETEPGIFRRIKIKNAQYLAYSRLKDAIQSPRNVMTLILGKNLDDALTVMPDEVKEKSLAMQEGIRRMFQGYKRDYNQLYKSVCESVPGEPHGSKEHRKAFALAAKSSGIWFEPAMLQYTGKCSGPEDFVAQKMDDNGSYGPSFLDYLIDKAEKATT